MKSLPAMFICAVLLGLCLYEKRAKELDMQRFGTVANSSETKSDFISEKSSPITSQDSLIIVPEAAEIQFPLASEIMLLKN